MNTIRDNVRLIYDLITFNFDIDGAGATPMAPGAVIPPELFPRILYWLAHEDTSHSLAAKLNIMVSSLGNPPKDFSHSRAEQLAIFLSSPFNNLQTCSLVCRFWANQSRRYLFLNKTLHISSLENARAFRHYTLHGSSKLIRICDLVQKILVKQWYNQPRSYLDLIYLPSTRTKLTDLDILGPFPDTISHCRLDTPHWSLTNGDSLAPSITPYNFVRLHDAAFPSFLGIIKYLKHFRAAQEIQLNSLTWDDKIQISLLRPIPTSSSRQRIFVQVSGQCTDSFLVGWHAVNLYADSFIHAILDRDQVWMLRLALTIRDYYEELHANHEELYPNSSGFYQFISGIHENPRVPMFMLVVAQGPEYPETCLTFVRDMEPLFSTVSTRNSPKPTRVVGLSVRLSVPNGKDAPSATKFNTPDIGYLRAQLEDRCALRVVVIVFNTYEDLKAIAQRYPSLQDPWAGAAIYRLAYGSPGLPLVAIDPTTLDRTGEVWANEIDAASLLGGHR